MLVSAALTAVTLLCSRPTAAQRIDRLVALAHLDAAVRYFHPSVATNAARWDSLFAANVIAVADAPNPAEYRRRIASVMLALGDTPPKPRSPQRTLKYNGFPSPTYAGSGGYSLEWKSAEAPVMYRVELGEGAQVDVRLSSDIPGPATATVSPVPTAPAWRAIYPSVGHRVLGAMRVWSTMRLFNPYQRLITESWDDQLRIALAAVEQVRDGVEYAKTIASFAAHVHDTHVTLSGDALRFVVPTIPVGVQARLIENQLVVTHIVDPAAARAGLRVGDVVVSVDGEAIDARIARLTPFISASTPQALRFRLQSSLLRGSDSIPARIVVRGATGEARAMTLRRSPEFYQGLVKHRTSSLIRILPGNIGYVDLERLPVQMVDSAFRVLSGTKAIVLDDRGYPLGTAWSIAPRLNVHGDGVVAAKFRRLIVSSPDTARTTVMEFDQPIPPAGGVSKYTGRTVMLIDERTLSQAEHTGLFFEAANGTKFIGSPTMGANGDVTSFVIPGGITMSFTGHDVRHADGSQLQRVGLQPVLAVLPTISGIRAGRDEVLEQAHRFLGGSGEIPRDTVDVPFVPTPTIPPSASALPPEPMPSGWMQMGVSAYRVGLDRAVGRSGGASGHVTAASPAPDGFGSLSQIIRADDYRGKRLRFSAYVKTRGVSGRGAGLWMRVDGNGGVMAFDNMQSRPLLGSADWSRASVVLDVPVEADGIPFGLILASGGEAWIEDASLEVVGTDVASTNMMAATADASKVAEQRASFANSPLSPVNLQLDP
jgi:C-terminal processing protease CtpA/Prc